MSIEINSKSAKSFARIGPRATYGAAMYSAIKNDQDYLLLSADLGKASGLDRLSKEFPEKFINCGIAEQSMVAFASGLAREGFTVFASSFAPFLSMRASEHVRMNLGYMEEPVTLVALGSGLSLGYLGNSHFGIEDVSVMRSIPNMTILCPADAGSIPKFIQACATYQRPVYLRLTGAVGSQISYLEDYSLEIGKINLAYSTGDEIAIIASGSSVGQSIKAAQELKNIFGITVYDCHTIKPIDEDKIVEIFNCFKNIISVEEHTIIGGLFSSISEIKSNRNLPGKIHALGILDEWVETGDYEYMLKMQKLDYNSIIRKIKSIKGVIND